MAAVSRMLEDVGEERTEDGMQNCKEMMKWIEGEWGRRRGKNRGWDAELWRRSKDEGRKEIKQRKRGCVDLSM